jgi:acyl carrier protein
VPLAPQQAILSLLIGLHFDERSLIVGLDGQHRRISRHVVGQSDVVERAVLYYEGTDSGTAEAALSEFAATDRFGVPVGPTAVRLVELPLDAAGRVDRVRLAAFAAGGADGQASTPRSDTERRLVDIWQRLLGVSSVRVDHNFFELGGDSLLAARLVAEIHEAFGRAVSLRAIFDAESLADLADTIAQSSRAASDAVVVPAACTETLTAADALARLDELADDEVEALLNRMVDATVDQR